MGPWARGKATRSSPLARTSHVSLASQKGPMELIIVSRSSEETLRLSMPTPKS